MEKVITVTPNPSLDVSSSVDRVVPEHKLRCKPPDFDAGGGGINVARAIVRLGGSALALYPCGGAAGEMLNNLVKREGVEQHTFPIKGLVRESVTVIEETSGQQYRFGFPGPKLSRSEWRAILEYVEGLDDLPGYVVASGSLPPGVPADFYGQLARIVRRQGVRFVVDTSGEPLCEAAEVGAYLLKPNLRELGQIAGRSIESDGEIEAAARALIHEGDNEIVLVSLGAGGAMLVTAEGAQRLRSPIVPIRSKVGAGDSMVGGMVYGLATGLEVLDAARLGVASGAAAVMTPGTDLMRREDAERLFEQMRGNAV